MNRKQRQKNRETAKWLKHQQKCTRCGKTGLHYVIIPQSLESIMMWGLKDGFWTCDDLYDEHGRRK
jgi:hypothetical protein